MSARLPGERVLNSSLSDARGHEVVKLDALRINKHDQVELRFESTNSDWRQGVWIATDGQLRVNGFESDQFVIWEDTAPSEIRVDVLATDGILRLYNVWDSGRGLGDHEAHSATSGMVIDLDQSGVRRYRCTDIGYEPAFDKVVFTIRVLGVGAG